MEGYVLSQYIMSDPPKGLLVDELNRENSELKNTKNNLQSQLEEAREKYGRYAKYVLHPSCLTAGDRPRLYR